MHSSFPTLFATSCQCVPFTKTPWEMILAEAWLFHFHYFLTSFAGGFILSWALLPIPSVLPNPLCEIQFFVTFSTKLSFIFLLLALTYTYLLLYVFCLWGIPSYPPKPYSPWAWGQVYTVSSPSWLSMRWAHCKLQWPYYSDDQFVERLTMDVLGHKVCIHLIARKHHWSSV